MNEITNRPSSGPKIIAYLRNPLTIQFPFSGTGFDLAGVTLSVALYKDGFQTLIQPTVSISGQTATVSFTAEDIAAMPRQTSLLVYLDGIVAMVCAVETANSAAPAPVGSVEVPVIYDGQAVAIPVSVFLQGTGSGLQSGDMRFNNSVIEYWDGTQWEPIPLTVEVNPSGGFNYTLPFVLN